MTERMARNIKWGTAAVVAPLAAGALTAATAWGVAHPASVAKKATATQDQPEVASGRPVAVVDRSSLDKPTIVLSQAATAEQARVVRLQKALARLHAQTRALSRRPIPGSGGGTTGLVPRTYAASGGGVVAAPPAVAVRAPAPRPAPAPAPAPVKHTSTGAS